MTSSGEVVHLSGMNSCGRTKLRSSGESLASPFTGNYWAQNTMVKLIDTNTAHRVLWNMHISNLQTSLRCEPLTVKQNRGTLP